LIVSIFVESLYIAFLADELVESCLVVSAVSLPGVLAPPEPVPVESPDSVCGLPLQALKANATQKTIIEIEFFIVFDLYKYNEVLVLFNNIFRIEIGDDVI
jgi:hypothetical protein